MVSVVTGGFIGRAARHVEDASFRIRMARHPLPVARPLIEGSEIDESGVGRVADVEADQFTGLPQAVEL
jgi:hypothetical protein